METPTVLTARLLVPFDGSALAGQALALQTPDTELVLAQVLPEAEPRYDPSAELTSAEAELERRPTAWGLPGERVTIEVRAGDPAETLLDIAAERDCTLTVLASHGRGAVGRWRFGSELRDRVSTCQAGGVRTAGSGDAHDLLSFVCVWHEDRSGAPRDVPNHRIGNGDESATSGVYSCHLPWR